ncbi:MAG: Hint domain-containing protein [Acidisphaera sp.]|nr:Hint domain-containing protein [Acidisphaera sp.]
MSTPINVSSGQTSSGTIGSGGTEYVLSGGTAIDTTVNSGGTLYISSGGNVSSSTINSSGELDLENGAITASLTFSGGTEVVLSGGTLTSQTVVAGGLQELVVSSGAQVSSTTVNSGGNLQVLGGGTAIGVTVAASGSVDDYGTVLFNGKGVTTVSSGATVRVESGGTAEVLLGTASGIMVLSGGTALVEEGGTSVDPVVSNGGTEIVFSTAVLALSGAGQTDAGTTFSGGTELLEGGAALTGRTLSFGFLQELIVASGGTAANIVVSSGATEIVSAGGMAAGETVYSGGALELVGGASAMGATFSGGTEILASGAAVTGPVLSATGLQELILSSGGSARGAMVGNGGTLDIISGGSASGTVVGNGGSEIVAFGGADSNTVVSGGGTLQLAGGTLVASEAAGGTLTEYGSIQGLSATIIQTGSGTLLLSGTDTFSGGSVIISAGTVELATSGSVGSDTFAFSPAAGGSATLQIDAPATPVNGGTFTDTIANFGTNDAIDLRGLTFSTGATATLSGSTLIISDGGTTIDLTLSNPGATQYYVHSDGMGGTVINDMPCFCRGTLMRTERGEVPIEDLAIGDRVATYGGAFEPIRWIGRRSYAGRFLAGKRHIMPVRIRAGALADNVPSRDLLVSPNHAMYLDGVLVPAGLLINGVSIVQEEAVESVEYIHIELAEHNVVWAEGAASETFIDDDSRAIFHNADDYASRYPDAPSGPALFCAPRLEAGYALEAVRRRIAERAGLTRRAPGLGELRGYLDNASGHEVRGWAQDTLHPEAPVCLDILVDGVVVAQALANRHRLDLQAAGLGSGRHSFAAWLPAPLPGAGVLEVRRSADGTLLARADLDARSASTAA